MFMTCLIIKKLNFLEISGSIKEARNHCKVIAASSVEVERRFSILTIITEVKRKSLVMETLDNLKTIPLLEILGKI